ncbi:hypothetical protein DASC09_055160 [Saccharomycopsis crataegensis]|uniref:PalH-domain-containing protein n=1 Tax=Saccharomycopsis crataegensis TaxID=43959 RepID=A0AAV5QUE1_9ASCO|nr:hypothetical protein DASC09_055160 [Saccharomycopsis crataegensis]
MISLEAARDAGCSLFVLLNGYVAFSSNLSAKISSPINQYASSAFPGSYANHTLYYPYFFLTNCSRYTELISTSNTSNSDYYYRQYLSIFSNLTSSGNSSETATIVSNIIAEGSSAIRNSFPDGFISICYVVCAVTVAAWSLVLLLVLSTNPRSKLANFLTLFYAIAVSVLLSKTTSLLDEQFVANYQDADQFSGRVLRDKVAYTLTALVKTFSCLAWGQLSVILSPVRFHKKLRITTSLTAILLLIFNMLHYTYPEPRQGMVFEFYYVMVTLIDLAIYFSFAGGIYLYIYTKRQFSLSRQVAPMSVFTGFILTGPPIFYLTYVVCDEIDNWATIITDFFSVLITILVWELHAKITIGEKRHERRTVLGRAIRHDELPISHDGLAKGGLSIASNNPGTKSRHIGYFTNPILRTMHHRRKIRELRPLDSPETKRKKMMKIQRRKGKDGDGDNTKQSGSEVQLHNLTEIQLSTPVGNEDLRDQNSGDTDSTTGEGLNTFTENDIYDIPAGSRRKDDGDFGCGYDDANPLDIITEQVWEDEDEEEGTPGIVTHDTRG